MSSIPYTLDMISCTSKVYDEVSNLVQNVRTVRRGQGRTKVPPEWCIVSIDRVKNPYLEEQFAATKTELIAKRGADGVKEVRAFHGTTEAGMAAILADGFDPSKNIRSVYGRGTYVALTAAFARSYAKENQFGDNVMILCRVLLGTQTQGMANTSINTAEHDYAVDNPKAPNMYVNPYRYGVIPEYVVQFYGKAR
jgi:hypothetical protein